MPGKANFCRTRRRIGQDLETLQIRGAQAQLAWFGA
jgi:hypothetical protein